MHYIIKRLITPDEATEFLASVPTGEGKLNSQTIHDDGEGKLVGFVSEVFMEDIYAKIFPEVQRKVMADKSYDYDISLDGLKVDVKAKQRTVGVEPDYDASIAAYTKGQQLCDTYAFCSVTVDDPKKKPFPTPLVFYYVGWMDKQEYMSKATYCKRGELNGNNIRRGSRFTIAKDCYNLKYNQLHQYDADILHPLAAKGYELVKW